MADHAALAHGLVLKGERARLLAMTPGTSLVYARHRKSASGFENVPAVRVVALDAIHPLFQNRMMLRQFELSMRREMALEARGRIPARIDDELPRAAARDVLAARPMTSLAATLTSQRARRFKVQARVRTGIERPD